MEWSARQARAILITGTLVSAFLAYFNVRAMGGMYQPGVGMVGDVGALSFAYVIPAAIGLFLSARVRRQSPILRRMFLTVTAVAVLIDVLIVFPVFMGTTTILEVLPISVRDQRTVGVVMALVGTIALPLETFLAAAFIAVLIRARESP